MTQNRYDPAKHAANREKRGVSLVLGDRIFEDDDHVIVASIREIDGEERFKVIGTVSSNQSLACSSGGRTIPVSCR